MAISDDTKRLLLRMARDAISAAVQGDEYEPPDPPAEAHRPAGAFVTVHQFGELRGCIGQIEARHPLASAVVQCAISAATRDPRFPPMTARELNEGTELEISVLTPMQRVSSPEEIEVGRDGLLIQQGYHSGLLLPQVATEWGWDRETLLAHTCRKAGLPQDAWKHGAEIYKFQAEIFSERDFAPIEKQPPHSTESS
jgi:AmmeMemoRadiSam system protein A